MEVLVNGKSKVLSGKVRKVKAEAPSARIVKIDGSQNVIGMIAPTIQILVTIPNLDKFKNEILELEAKEINLKKVSITIVTTEEKEKVNEFIKSNTLEKIEFVFDEMGDFSKKFGVMLDSEFKLAHSLFLIDKEGTIQYIEITSDIFEKLNLELAFKALNEILSEKKKGHSHENWMRA